MRRLARALLVLVFLPAAACASDGVPDDIAAVAEVRDGTANGQDAVVMRPKGDLVGTVIYFHGAGEDAADVYLDKHKRAIIVRLLEDGWLVLASDAHGDAWGNQDSIDDYAALAQRYGRGTVVGLSQSMGGAPGLTCIVQGCIDLAAWVGVYPVADQRTVTADLAHQATVAFGGQVPESMIPVLHPGPMTLPMLLWASPQDTVVPYEQNGLALQRAVSDAGGDIELITAKGQHGDPSHFDPDRVSAFFAQALGSP